MQQLDGVIVHNGRRMKAEKECFDSTDENIRTRYDILRPPPKATDFKLLGLTRLPLRAHCVQENTISTSGPSCVLKTSAGPHLLLRRWGPNLLSTFIPPATVPPFKFSVPSRCKTAIATSHLGTESTRSNAPCASHDDNFGPMENIIDAESPLAAYLEGRFFLMSPGCRPQRPRNASLAHSGRGASLGITDHENR